MPLNTRASQDSARTPRPQDSVALLVVTPTLGLSEYLDDAVRSVTALSFPVRHVLSAPRHVLESLRQRFPHALVVEDAGKQGAIYGAINAAIGTAPPDWSWFTYINDDDLLAQDFERMFLQHLARPKPEPVTYGNVRLIDERGAGIGFLTTERTPRFIPAVLHAGISPLNQQGMLFRRDVVEALGGFDLKYRLCADLDFWARAMAAGFAFRHYPLEVGRFRLRRGQLSGNVALTRREQDEITHRAFPHMSRARRLFAKWRYRFFNLPRYFARSRTVGWKTSDQLLEAGKEES
jgi:hypothetical protein